MCQNHGFPILNLPQALSEASIQGTLEISSNKINLDHQNCKTILIPVHITPIWMRHHLGRAVRVILILSTDKYTCHYASVQIKICCESPPLRYRGQECFQLKGTFTCHRTSLQKFTLLFRLFCEFFSLSLFEMQRHNKQQSKSTFPGA